MSRFSFEFGTIFDWNGKRFKVIDRVSNKEIKIESLIDSSNLIIAEKQLIQELFDKKITFLPITFNNDSEVVDLISNSDFTEISETLRNEAKRRFNYVTEFTKRGYVKSTHYILNHFISAFSVEIGDVKPPSSITLYRWIKTFKEKGNDIRSLIPLTNNRGNKAPRLPLQVISIIDKIINEYYLQPNRPSVKDTYDRVMAEIISENRFREENNKLPIPDPSTIYRWINDIDEYDKDRKRFGEQYARIKHAPIMANIPPTRPLERIEIDHTKLDLFVVDEERRMPVGRPYLTAAIDVYTKSVIGCYIGFDPYGSLSVMQCLKHSVMDKSYVMKKYLKVENEWYCYGLPQTIVCDNGKEFLGKHFEDACLQLGITIQYSPIRVPNYKGSIETYFRTINLKLLHNLPGTSFSNILEREDYDPKKNAVISFEALNEILHIWICDIYHQEYQRGLKTTPAKKWEKSIIEYPPAFPRSFDDMDVFLGIVEERVISRHGIELYGLYYNSKELGELRRQIGSKQTIRVKIDPTNIEFIRVVGPIKSLTVSSVSGDYTRGLTLWQHDLIRKLARQEFKNIDLEALCRAKEKINDMVYNEWLTTKKSQTKERLARWKGIGSKAGLNSKNYDKEQDIEINFIEDKPVESNDLKTIEQQESKKVDTSDDWIPDQSGWSSGCDMPC